MTILSNNTLNADELALLVQLAKKSLMSARLAEVNGTVIYQIAQSWQYDVVSQQAEARVTSDATEFEQAVQEPEIHIIIVPKNASLTQEIAQRILERNPLTKTVFWEV